MLDLHEVNLSTFGDPMHHSVPLTGDSDDSIILDAQLVPKFDKQTNPYVFLRLNDSIKFLNLNLEGNGEYRLTTLLKTWLTPLPFKHSLNSILSL